MFVAIRDLKFARGRFLLMGSVVALVAFLVLMLSGLAGGLVKANISGLMALPATHIALEATDHPTYRNTMVERYMWEGWAEQEGVRAIEPLGHTGFTARTEDGKPLEVALWGLVDDSFIAPPPNRGDSYGGDVENGVVISRGLLDDGVDIGDIIVLDRVLTELRVVGVTDMDRSIGHMPIIYAPLAKWQEATYGPPGGPLPGETLPDILFDFVSIIVLQLDDAVDIAALDDEFETITLDRLGFYMASTGYESEINSVQMIQSLLFVISAVIVGAFFSIWTIQRTKEIGLIKALGASNAYVLKDALGQALLLIVLGTLVGLLGTLWLNELIKKTQMLFMLEGTMMVTSIIMLVIAGVIGATMSIRRILRVDPIIALGRDQ